MNQDIKKQWQDALNSGDYPQTHGFLRTTQGFCCLGVLCELAVKAGVIPLPVPTESGEYEFASRETKTLPLEVMEWAGLDSRNPHPVGLNSLAWLNDHGYSFKEIAQGLEQLEHLEQLG